MRKIIHFKGLIILCLLYLTSILSYGQLNYKTTWVANSGGTLKTFNQMYMIGATVNQAGISAGVCYWDEGGRGLGLYSNEGNVTNLEWDNRDGGTNVGINLHFVYNAGASTITKRSITKTTTAVKTATISGLRGGSTNGDFAYSLTPENANSYRMKLGITGVSANEFYVVAAVYQLNKVYVYDVNLNLLRTISVDRAYYATADNLGNVWVVQGADKNNAPNILEFDNSGNPTGKAIPGLSDPRSLQISKKGQLIVGDNGLNQQVYFYDVTGAPLLVDTFGQKGGIRAGVPGQVKPDKFSGIVFAGTDSLDNLYVITDLEGAIIRRFDKDRNLLWQKFGLAFVDMADADPNNENDIYSSEERYSMDYSKAKGQEQNFAACTMDPYKYPQDARINTSLDGGVWIRWINGKKFMFVGHMYGEFIFIYRFNEATDGEIAVPCGAIMKHTRFGFGANGEWPPKQPRMGSFIWRDKNGDGKYDEDEYETVPYEISLSNIDDVGNVYKGGLDYFECQGLDNIGNPVYSFKNIITVNTPEPFSSMKKTVYDNDRDIMYISGNTADVTNSYNVGPVFAVYRNWSKGNRTAAWEKVYNFVYGGFAAKGDYLFAAYTQNMSNSSIDVFSAKDGSKVGNMVAPIEMLPFGWIDIPWGANVAQRTNGEYLVFEEDDLAAKTVIYRWNPYANDNEFPTKPNALKIDAKTSTSITVSFRTATDVTGLSGYFIYANGVRTNANTVYDSIYTIKGLTPETSYEIYVSAADFAGHETKSDTITVVTYPVDVSAPSKPIGFRASNETISSMNLSWNSSTDNVGVTGYDLFLNNTKLGFKPIQDTVYVLTDLKPSTDYIVKLVAYDFVGNTSDTSSITASTKADTVAPSDPILIATTQHSSSEIAINWKTSSDNSYVVYYDLYNNGVLLKGKIPAHEYMGIPVSGDYMLYKVTGLDANTSYAFSLKAVDLAGYESGFSNILPMKTDSVWSRLLDVEEANMGIGYTFYFGTNMDLSGFLFGSMMSGYMEWTVDIPTDTIYRVVCHYTTMESLIYQMQIDVNGVKQAAFELKQLPNMTWWGYEDDPNFVFVKLKAGKNIIRLNSFTQWAPNLDLVKILVAAPFINVSTVMLDANSITMQKGDSVQLNATIEPFDATDKRLIWKSSKLSVAKIDNTGLVRGAGIGSATITVTSVDGALNASCLVTVSPVTGVDEMKGKDLVDIYPNPAKDALFVKLADLQGNHRVEVQLYNTLSRMVMQSNPNNCVNGDILKFNTSTLSNGVYFLRLTMGNQVYIRKVVISK